MALRAVDSRTALRGCGRYERGNPTPPIHYFKKVVAKEGIPEFISVLAQKEAASEEGHFPAFVVFAAITAVVAILVMNHFTD
eukprot:m.136709 g.136709  ORF g.136709 m.136709 type:complete len:82 (-) comp22642_c0_seq1:57-302(-)